MVERLGARSVPLTANQWGMVFLDQIMPDSAMYHVMWTCPVDGVVDMNLLRQALTSVVRKHAALRTRFELSADLAKGGQQIIDENPRIDLELVPAPAADADREADLDYRGTLAHLVDTPPFSLAEGPLFRVRVLRYTPRRHRLVVNVHHLVFDGWSVGVFLTDLAASYTDLCRGGDGGLPSQRFGYAEYADGQDKALPALVAEQLPYWRDKLAGLPAVSTLPTDHPRPLVQSYSGAEFEITLPTRLRDAAVRSAKSWRLTPFVVFLAAFTAQLAAYAGGGDVVVGCPMGARTQPAARGLIGYLINMTVLRSGVSLAMSLRAVLDEVRSTVLDAVANQDVPFDVVVSDLRPERGLGHNPFFQVLFSFEEDDPHPVRLGDACVGDVRGIPTMAAKFDLTFTVRYGVAGLSLHLEYATDLYEPATIATVAADYERTLSAMLTDPSTVVGAVPVALRPRPDPAAAPASVTSAAPYVAPRSDIEREILLIWSDVLKIAGLGVHDDFFRVGGDSLSASRVIWRVGERYAVTLPVRAMFTDPTVAGFAAQVESLRASPPAQPAPVIPRRRTKLSELVGEPRSEV